MEASTSKKLEDKPPDAGCKSRELNFTEKIENKKCPRYG